ncbi:MAG: glycosyl hydrolase-related protein [Oscillospiraceae bacterium]|jgi:alpha-mannosidase|nr:glycosyl hydrolase-related protein [Oscillospiraceae bacterium]
MLPPPQIDMMLSKLRRLEKTIERKIFTNVGEIRWAEVYRTFDQLDAAPDAVYEPINPGYTWGTEWEYMWLKTSYTVPAELDGKALYLITVSAPYEALLFVNGTPYGLFNRKDSRVRKGGHYANLLTLNAKAGETYDLVLEYYAGNTGNCCETFEFTWDGFDVAEKEPFLIEFLFDLNICGQLAQQLPPESARRGQIINGLYKLFGKVWLDDARAPAPKLREVKASKSAGVTVKQNTGDSGEDAVCTARVTEDGNAEGFETFVQALKASHPILKELLALPADPASPSVGLSGHSHMDTAWLWPVGETIKKMARTYSTAIALMDEYPEYTFVQSSAAHCNFMLKHYPALHELMKQKIAEGRYDPNGAVWVECDCNITGGEAMIRQFLWGQRFTQKQYGYTANAFWLPDTFGYSAAIPQIMRACKVKYFVTQKIGWNDTNKFPYDTFYWEGIDGSRVFAHFHIMHAYPEVKELLKATTKNYAGEARQMSVQPRRMLNYGFGDGGGGPLFEMIEMAKRLENTNGCPPAKHIRPYDYLQELEESTVNPPTYRGELYLEVHRGTLTNQHTIKRNNRKCELALRDWEILLSAKALAECKQGSMEEINAQWEVLLLNQFHDILPGTGIPRVHEEARTQVNAAIAASQAAIAALLGTPQITDSITLVNTLSFGRRDPMFLEVPNGKYLAADCKQQVYTDMDGKQFLLVTGLEVGAFGKRTVSLTDTVPATEPVMVITKKDYGVSDFAVSETILETPFFRITFDDRWFITSCLDKESRIELVDYDSLDEERNYPLGALIMAEEWSNQYDNWDIDADTQLKYRDTAELLAMEIVSNGPAALVLRLQYRISPKSTVMQDVMFFADSREIRYITRMDWQDDHRLLKAWFNTNLREDFVRNEIQFGYLKRPTTRNTSIEQAKFEVVNHKYSDLSETRYGVAILNDCKYGISCEGGSLRLSLHKGGIGPDWTGDHECVHECIYSFLPHIGGFSAENVVHPAYCLNVPVLQAAEDIPFGNLPAPDVPNIIAEAVKPTEDAPDADLGCAILLRLYECEGTHTVCHLPVAAPAHYVELTDMLEEVHSEIPPRRGSAEIHFDPFEIQTVKLLYDEFYSRK